MQTKTRKAQQKCWISIRVCEIKSKHLALTFTKFKKLIFDLMRQVKKEVEHNYNYFVHNFHQGVVNHYTAK